MGALPGVLDTRLGVVGVLPGVLTTRLGVLGVLPGLLDTRLGVLGVLPGVLDTRLGVLGVLPELLDTRLGVLGACAGVLAGVLGARPELMGLRAGVLDCVRFGAVLMDGLDWLCGEGGTGITPFLFGPGVVGREERRHRLRKPDRFLLRHYTRNTRVYPAHQGKYDRTK